MRTSRKRSMIRRMMVAEGMLIVAFLSAFILHRSGLLGLRGSGLDVFFQPVSSADGTPSYRCSCSLPGYGTSA